MKNLNPTAENSTNLLRDAFNGKEDEELKRELSAISRQIGTAYAVFDSCYKSNKLQVLVPDPTCAGKASWLYELYSYNSKAIREFRERLALLQTRPVRYICQFCTLTAHDTLDHFIPQTEFPEFIVHPLNLIPACSRCNRKKSSIWREVGRRKLLNLYMDKLPNIQYLFVDIFWDDNFEIDFKFTLSNKNGIDEELYELLQSHYERLDLLYLMRNAAITEFSEIVSSIANDLRARKIDDLLADVRRDGEDMRQQYGFNHWKAILKTGLGTSAVFKSLFS